MKCKMQTGELGAALAVVNRAIASRPVRPVMEGVMLETGENAVTLTATNGNMTIRTTVSAWVDEGGKTVLPGKLLSDLVRRLPDSEVDLELSDGMAKVRCGRSRSSLTAMDAAEFPDTGTFRAAHTLTVPAVTLKEMIDGVSFAASGDENRQALTAIRMTVSEGTLRMVALDGFRMATATLTGFVDDCAALIPSATMRELSRVLPADDTECVLSISEKNITVEFGGTVLSAVTLNTEYPDTSKLIPAAFATEALVNRQEMMGAIGRTELLARGGHNNLIRVRVAEDGLYLSSRADVGEMTEDVHAEVTGKPLDIAFNAKYLTDVFGAIGSDEVTVKMNSPTAPAIIVPKGEQNRLYLVLPVRTA